MTANSSAVVMAGIPATNFALYHRLRFLVGDPTALIELPEGDGVSRTLLLRDIEMERARKHARVDRVGCPADYAPESGLSGDRETATAQAVAELLRRNEIRTVTVDRSLPYIFAHHIAEVSIGVECDLEMGVLERRSKDEQEIAWLREAQQVTEDSMAMACEMVARATANAEGLLISDGAPLTSERVRAAVDIFLTERGYANPGSIVACGPAGADCHDRGSGEIHTGQPVIIDIFPTNRQTLYNGDCTRTVVHGDICDRLVEMHRVVVAAKAAAVAATRTGATGEDVHRATIGVIEGNGFAMGLPRADDPLDYCAMTHGTGHGVGLDVHEPPLLDFNGPELVRGDCLTIEPGLYSRAIGGVRVEDMVIVEDDGCDNFNQLSEGLAW
ncbi:MAG: M24 family metallopeptidase [Pirellulaceae bacterium]|jgi:Xaa-Pro aminopeptidase|nr:M24 family metallopeptidase [Pirellulaceae bacterium]